MAKIKKLNRKPSSQDQARTWNQRMNKNEYKYRRMTFGKYTNWFIKDIPMDYLKWAILNLTDNYWLDYLCRELCSRDPSFKYQSPKRKTSKDFFNEA